MLEDLKYNDLVWSIFNNRISCFRWSGLGGQPIMNKLNLIFRSKEEAEHKLLKNKR